MDIPIAVSQAWADNACGLINPGTRPSPLLLTQERPAPPTIPPWPPSPPLSSVWEPDPADPLQGGVIGNSCVVIHDFDSAGGVGTPGFVGGHISIIPTNWGTTVQELRNGAHPISSLSVDDTWTLGGDPIAANAADIVGVTSTAGKNSFLQNAFPSGPGYMNNRLQNTIENVGTTQWNALVPVYQAADCTPPSGNITIVGFTTVTINTVRNWISIESLCPTVATGKGHVDTQNFGTLASIPVLVQ
ncbi:MAG: hypothetical protein O7F12_09110 [Nitrospirae bacterium]|nr:hypothetical protein [Nitrospirota bacterium]